MIIDTHAHLYDSSFSEDFEKMLQRAAEKRVKKIFLPNVDYSTSAALVNLCKSYPGLFYGMMGLHPCSVNENYRQELDTLFALFETETFYAVGEIGLDLYWDKTTLPMQKAAFEYQLHKSLELDLPVAIHCRDAFDEIFEIIEKPVFQGVRGIFHCFTGNAEQAKKLIDLGYHLGIGGVCTFKNGGLDVSLKDVPLEKLVLETDSPYLAPVPYRGKRNEPSYLHEISQRLADIKETTLDNVVRTTTQNALTLFGIS